MYSTWHFYSDKSLRIRWMYKIESLKMYQNENVCIVRCHFKPLPVIDFQFNSKYYTI